MAVFIESEKDPKIHMKPQKIPDSKRNPEQKEKYWWTYSFRLQGILHRSIAIKTVFNPCTREAKAGIFL